VLGVVAEDDVVEVAGEDGGDNIGCGPVGCG
jgi:hypothetical protein